MHQFMGLKGCMRILVLFLQNKTEIITGSDSFRENLKKYKQGRHKTEKCNNIQISGFVGFSWGLTHAFYVSEAINTD